MNEQIHPAIDNDDSAAKQPWSPPQMTEVDTVAVTLFGGIVVADTDPNQPS